MAIGLLTSRGGLLALIALVAACAGPAPSPTPAGAETIFEALASRGATVTGIVGGDPGCDEADLVDNAIRFELRGRNETVPRTVHLFTFRDRMAFEAAATSFRRCLATVLAGAGERVDSFESSPYRLLARGLSDEDLRLLREILTAR